MGLCWGVHPWNCGSEARRELVGTKRGSTTSAGWVVCFSEIGEVNGLVNTPSAFSSIVSGFVEEPRSRWKRSPSVKPVRGLRDCKAPPAVAGRRVSVGDGRAKSREMAGSASAEEKDPPPTEPVVEEEKELAEEK